MKKKIPRSQSDVDWDRKIGAAIKFIRNRDANQSQAVFAKRMGISRSHLTNIETGRTPLTVSIGWKMCQTFDLHPTWIVAAGNSHVQNVFPEIPSEQIETIEAHLRAAASAPLRAIWPSLAWRVASDADEPKKEFDSVTLFGNTVGVKSEVEKLVARLKRVTAKPGKKAELARHMGVAPARVSEWLSGQEPGGEYALKLLRWVEQQERQK